MSRLLPLVLLVLAGCAASSYDAKWRVTAVPPGAATTASEQATALAAEGDAAWLLRDDVAKLREAIAKWEAAGASWADGALYSRIARAHYFLADAYLALEPDADARDREYTASLDWSVKALKLTAPDMAKALGEGASMTAAVKQAPKESSEALLWYASSLGKWAAMHGPGPRTKVKDDLKAIIDHVTAIDPSQHGATYRWLGAYEAQTINILGGSAERSEAYFKKSLEAAPNYLGTRVLWAQFLCPKTGDRELARKLLTEVIEADPSLDPGSVPENKADQRKARLLLPKVDTLFGP